MFRSGETALQADWRGATPLVSTTFSMAAGWASTVKTLPAAGRMKRDCSFSIYPRGAESQLHSAVSGMVERPTEVQVYPRGSLARSSTAEHPVDNRTTAERHRASQPIFVSDPAMFHSGDRDSKPQCGGCKSHAGCHLFERSRQ